VIRWNTWPLRRDPEWTRRPGASPPDAHACIMVLVPIDQPNTSLRRDIASRAGSPRKSSSCRQRHLLVSTSSLAPGSRRSRAASLRDGPMATLDRHSARTPSRLEVETRRCRPPSNKGDDRNDLTTIPLDHAPYKYSRASVIWPKGCGVLDTPLSRSMTTGVNRRVASAKLSSPRSAHLPRRCGYRRLKTAW